MVSSKRDIVCREYYTTRGRESEKVEGEKVGTVALGEVANRVGDHRVVVPFAEAGVGDGGKGLPIVQPGPEPVLGATGIHVVDDGRGAPMLRSGLIEGGDGGMEGLAGQPLQKDSGRIHEIELEPARRAVSNTRFQFPRRSIIPHFTRLEIKTETWRIGILPGLAAS
jgi:hypothetical protein